MTAPTPADLAAAMVRRHRTAREAAERRAVELKRGVAVEASALVAEGWARRVWLVGTLAWGTFGDRSDVDVVFEGLGRERIGAVAARLGDRLRARVDVLRLEDLPAGFQARVHADGVVLVS